MEILELLKAVLFGIVEGITEWLPISSTGHMILFNQFVKLNVSEDFWKLFEVVIQFGAILAVVLLFWNKLWPFTTKTVKKRPTTTSIDAITYKEAVIIGLFQLAAAVFPGTSRSGATIVGALMIGVSRATAAEFTFFLAVPVMFGASLLKAAKYILAGIAMTGGEALILLVGTVVAFIVSVFVIKFLMGYIKKHDFKIFGWYRIILGILVILILR